MDRRRHQARDNFRKMRFGMFIHWGIYSLLERGEWVMFQEKIPVEEYKLLMHRFNPHLFDANEWVSLAQRAGMRYITITAKHHDGFCMYDSDLTDYKITNTPFRRDVMRELAEACRKARLSLFFYYSPLDWQHPAYKSDWDAYTRYWHGQVIELVKKYRPYGIWLDGCWDKPEKLDETWKLSELYKAVRNIQPALLIANNHHQKPLPEEDIQNYEQDLPGENKAGFNPVQPDGEALVETCMTINRSWGYNASDSHHKSASELVRILAECAGRDANLLLNVGPKPNGTIQSEHRERLLEIGQWLQINGSAVYATRGKVVEATPWGTATRSGRRVYLHIWNPPQGEPLNVPASIRIKSAYLLAGSEPIRTERGANNILVYLPEPLPDAKNTVVVLEG